MVKIDPYKHEESYRAWQGATKNGVPDISKANSDLVKQYLFDMEHGLNVSIKSVKGGRSFIRLNSLREKIIYFSKRFKEFYDIDNITEISEGQLMIFFSKMRSGEIQKLKGGKYKGVVNFVKAFKAFWHWWQTVNRKKGIEIPDITVDLDTRNDKPKWVYLTEEQVKRLVDSAKPHYKTLIMFLYDTGIRAPTELINVKVGDLYNNCKELMIRDEISKTFGRRIKLMLCSDLLKKHIEYNGLKSTDYLFPIKPQTVNKYFNRLGERVFGDDMSEAGQKYKQLTMYDFRHCSCCYWLPRYKSESALKYRFGWKKSDKIHYYSELLGMKDTIAEEDMFVDVTKTELEQQLSQSDRKREIADEKIKILEAQMKMILKRVNEIENGYKRKDI